jgi:hypothetical protein
MANFTGTETNTSMKTEPYPRPSESNSQSLPQSNNERQRDIHYETDSDTEVNSTEKRFEETEPAQGESSTTAEVRDGIPDDHDVEAQSATLEKQKSSESNKDPNLVSHASFLHYPI